LTNILVYSCTHADPEFNNNRFLWLGNYIYETKPDIVVDLGDGADLRSLNSYDTAYPQAIVAQNYGKDINAYLDAQEKLRHPFRMHHRRKPYWIGMEGNHEHRIKKAIAKDPRIEGQDYGISYRHLETSRLFDEYHEYENSAPSIANYRGVDFAHYFAVGNSPRAVAGLHHANTLINKRHNSSVCGHSHLRDVKFNDLSGSTGLVVGCFKGGQESWAGQSNHAWWHGAVLLKDVDNGRFEPEFISMKEMERGYGTS
jgi:hypothetical protein